MTALCSPWITPSDVIACGCPDTTPATMELAIDAASEILYRLTGQSYPGECQATLRPCCTTTDTFPIGWSYPWFPMRVDGVWLNCGPCGCNRKSCGCISYPSLNLGRSDIQSIVEVQIDGDILPDDSYRLDENQYLIRVDGEGWPRRQNLGLDLGAPNTWGVEVTYGKPIPADLVQAAGKLAMEFVKACENDSSCRLPQRTQTVSRQGVAIGFLDPFDFLTNGKTGLFEVDLAITAHNPNNLSRTGRVISPTTGVGVWQNSTP